MVFIRAISARVPNYVSTFFKSYSTSVSPALTVTNENSKKTVLNSKPIVHNGDDGKSITLSGVIQPKDHDVFHAIGITEELTSTLGLAKEFAQDSSHEYVDKLKRIQTVLIDMSTNISKCLVDPKSPQQETTAVALGNQYTKELEEWIHEYSQQLPPVDQFIIPGGGKASASLHVSRSICRKAERIVIPLVRSGCLNKDSQVYLNRLGDFLFTVARMAAKYDKRTESVYVPKPNEKQTQQPAAGQQQPTQPQQQQSQKS
ncbi:corrinoid adenosyltransferase-like [Chrysoperla carnea]|uniref:corrinoid adenosyltransferase-like n=1 Tax=Chrysoperla carnea TaxID=189513 RepID=UPI001D092711|nr:corrinoid adenosyltransferase-like [Chrysoperla carnea]